MEETNVMRSSTLRGSDLCNLTRRELEVIQLLIAGKSNKVIAVSLCVCERLSSFISTTSIARWV